MLAGHAHGSRLDQKRHVTLLKIVCCLGVTDPEREDAVRTASWKVAPCLRFVADG